MNAAIKGAGGIMRSDELGEVSPPLLRSAWGGALLAGSACVGSLFYPLLRGWAVDVFRLACCNSSRLALAILA